MQRTLLLSAALVLAVACAAPTNTPQRPAPAGAAPAQQAAATPAAGAQAAAQPPAAAAPAAAQQAAPPPLSPPVTVRIGLLLTMSDAGVFIAQERGYFAAEGLELDITRVDGAAQAMPHLATGQLDAAGITPAAGFFNAVSRGLPLRLAGDKGRQTPEYSSGSVSLRPDVADSGRVRDWPDLRGMIFGINVPNTGSVTDLQLDRMLDRGGLTRDDITIVALTYPDMNAAFANRSIEVGYQVEPFVSLGENQGVLRRWRSTGDITPDQYSTAWVYSPGFAETEAGYRFMVAYLRGARDFHDAFVLGRGKPAVVDILVQHTTVKDKSLYEQMRFNALDPDGRIIPERIADDVQYYLSKGYMQQSVDVAQVLDPRFTEYALARLGPYRPPAP